MKATVSRLMVLASGGATTLEAIVNAIEVNKKSGLPLNFEIGLVVGDHPEKTFPVVERLNRLFGLNIQMEVVNRRLFPRGKAKRGISDEESEVLCDLFERGGFAAIVCLGYMRVLRGRLIERYGWKEGGSLSDVKIINTHPGKLPESADTYGEHTSQLIIDRGLAATACTLHAVSAGVDTGKILYEATVPVLPGDDAERLFERVRVAEKAVLPLAIDSFLARRG
jgi:folate-dependent phosphoribosylglycinamide formyltransferase PurN